MDLDRWTKDKNGAPVDWTAAPHYVRGVLCTLLEGEVDVARGEQAKRIGEYLALASGRARMTPAGVELVVLDPDRQRYPSASWRNFFGVLPE